ncbi:MAG: GNAT family N-acetyltransferase [Bacilli bacterium]|jgi:ribosomal protein S18 acetylase RimI-like enzyme|nr:GNAT family N-acetyltransferase [Bacilli bacterium]
MEITVSKVEMVDYTRACEIMEDGIKMLKEAGSSQWQDGHPNKELIKENIEKGKLRGVYVDKRLALIASFSYIPDPSYKEIFSGQWLSKEDKYLTIHTLAVGKDYHGLKLSTYLFRQAEKEAKEHNLISLRADTYKLNLIMQHIFLSLGFKECGIIYLVGQSGDNDRLAYEKIL